MFWYAGGLACCCVYASASWYLLRHPQVLHGRRREELRRRFRRCTHISHRGGAGEGYENTLGAFSHAVNDAKTDMLELDCHLTADGTVVVLHDRNLKRVSGVDNQVSAMDFHNLPPLLPVLPIDFEPPQSYFSSDKQDLDSRKIPSLESVFVAFPEVDINIDIKVLDQALVTSVNELVRKYRRESRTVWGTFKYRTTELCYKANPDIGLLFSFQRVVQVLLLYYTGLLPFFPLKETHFEVPMPSALGKVKGQPTLAKILDLILMRKTLFEHLRGRGIHVYVWVLNSEAEFQKAYECGVSGVMTDYPLKLTEFLKNNLDLVK